MTKYLLFFSALLLINGYGNTLSCYRCSDDVIGEQPCNDPDNFVVDDCSYLDDLTKEKICYIVNAEIDDLEVQDRGCFYKEPVDGTDFCTFMNENTPDSQISCDVCEEDLCNK